MFFKLVLEKPEAGRPKSEVMVFASDFGLRTSDFRLQTIIYKLYKISDYEQTSNNFYGTMGRLAIRNSLSESQIIWL